MIDRESQVHSALFTVDESGRSVLRILKSNSRVVHIPNISSFEFEFEIFPNEIERMEPILLNWQVMTVIIRNGNPTRLL